VYREAFTDKETVAMAHRKPGRCFVARLMVADVLSLGLSVVPDPLDDPPAGHALIPEINAAAYRQDKERQRQLQLELAILAGHMIVFEPQVTCEGRAPGGDQPEAERGGERAAEERGRDAGQFRHK